MEHTVLTSHLEALNLFIGRISVIVVLQVQIDGVALYRHVLERRTLVENLSEAVVASQCCIGQSLAHLLFLGGMYLCRLIGEDEVVGADKRTVGNNLLGTELLLAEQCPICGVYVVVVVGRNLHKVEGYLAQGKLLSPLFHKQFQTFRILVAGVSHV